MIRKTIATFAILAALCLSIASAQKDPIVRCNCDWLQISNHTVAALTTDSFQISSIHLDLFYIPSQVTNTCGNIDALGK